MAKIAIIYYSATGNHHKIALAIEEGAKSQGAETRVRKVKELAPAEAIATNAGWLKHSTETAHVAEATLDDLEWSEGYILGAPTRYGAPAAQLKQFIDSSGPLWMQGKLANKAAASFTGAGNPHGGQEATLLALNNTFYHWGSIIVPIGYTDPSVYASGGNPYGLSSTNKFDGSPPTAEVLATARYLGQRVARVAAVLAENAGRLVG